MFADRDANHHRFVVYRQQSSVVSLSPDARHWPRSQEPPPPLHTHRITSQNHPAKMSLLDSVIKSLFFYYHFLNTPGSVLVRIMTDCRLCVDIFLLVILASVPLVELSCLVLRHSTPDRVCLFHLAFRRRWVLFSFPSAPPKFPDHRKWPREQHSVISARLKNSSIVSCRIAHCCGNAERSSRMCSKAKKKNT